MPFRADKSAVLTIIRRLRPADNCFIRLVVIAEFSLCVISSFGTFETFGTYVLEGRLQYDHPLGLCLVAAGRGNTIPLKETLDLPDPTWLQFRRRLDKLNPFCRIAGHTSEEVREILAALETVYRELFPQLNLRQWAGTIYIWLTQPVLDPTSSGRLTMDYLMKLVTTALEWTYQAGETDVRAETLSAAASLLVLRRDTLWLIDGAGPSIEAHQSKSNGLEQASETEAEQDSSLSIQPEKTTSAPTEPVNQTLSPLPSPDAQGGVQSNKKQAPQSTKCTFSGIVPIDLKRFQESGVSLVECPDCARMWTLEPRGGALRFKLHDKRKTTTPNTGQRWAKNKKGNEDWDVVGS